MFVGNLPHELTDEELREEFENVGEIVEIRMPRDRDSGEQLALALTGSLSCS